MTSEPTSPPPTSTEPPPAAATTPPSAVVATPAAAPEQFELIDIDLFAKIKLRVARIEAAEALPKSKKLLKLQLDLGHLGKRQILAGIAQFYTPESLIGRKIVVVANLKPAMLMGNESQGMMLAGSSPDGTKLAFLSPEQDLPEGSEVR
jgi:methionyl-tRNA synthetase